MRVRRHAEGRRAYLHQSHAAYSTVAPQWESNTLTPIATSLIFLSRLLSDEDDCKTVQQSVSIFQAEVKAKKKSSHVYVMMIILQYHDNHVFLDCMICALLQNLRWKMDIINAVSEHLPYKRPVLPWIDWNWYSTRSLSLCSIILDFSAFVCC